jgi:hypothetical protein
MKTKGIMKDGKIDATELDEVLEDFFANYGGTKLTEDAWAVLKLGIFGEI